MDIVNAFLHQWSHTLWDLSWQIAILVGVIGLISRLSWKASPNFRYWLWCIVLFRLCIPVELTLPIGIKGEIRQEIGSLFSPLSEKPAVVKVIQFGTFLLRDV